MPVRPYAMMGIYYSYISGPTLRSVPTEISGGLWSEDTPRVDRARIYTHKIRYISGDRSALAARIFIAQSYFLRGLGAPRGPYA